MLGFSSLSPRYSSQLPAQRWSHSHLERGLPSHLNVSGPGVCLVGDSGPTTLTVKTASIYNFGMTSEVLLSKQFSVKCWSGLQIPELLLGIWTVSLKVSQQTGYIHLSLACYTTWCLDRSTLQYLWGQTMSVDLDGKVMGYWNNLLGSGLELEIRECILEFLRALCPNGALGGNFAKWSWIDCFCWWSDFEEKEIGWFNDSNLQVSVVYLLSLL